MLAVCERGVERPGCAFAPDRCATRFLGSERQRAVGGRIQVANMARYLEKGALRGKHLDDLFFGYAYHALSWPRQPHGPRPFMNNSGPSRRPECEGPLANIVDV